MWALGRMFISCCKRLIHQLIVLLLNDLNGGEDTSYELLFPKFIMEQEYTEHLMEYQLIMDLFHVKTRQKRVSQDLISFAWNTLNGLKIVE